MLEEGVQIICKKVLFIAEHTQFSDRRVYMSGLTELSVMVSNSIFEGRDQGEKCIGGLMIETFPSLPNPSVTVENCIFKNLRFEDMAREIAWNYFYHAAAFTVKVCPMEFLGTELDLPGYYENFSRDVIQSEISSFGIPDNSMTFLNNEYRLVDHYQYANTTVIEFNFKILNSTFEKNHQAFSAVYDPLTYRPSVLISNSRFRKNIVVLDGGAIQLSGLSYVKITSCEFVKNSAGANVSPLC